MQWQDLLQTLCGRDPCLHPRGCWRRMLCRTADPALGSPSHPSALVRHSCSFYRCSPPGTLTDGQQLPRPWGEPSPGQLVTMRWAPQMLLVWGTLYSMFLGSWWSKVFQSGKWLVLPGATTRGSSWHSLFLKRQPLSWVLCNVKNEPYCSHFCHWWSTNPIRPKFK